MLIASIRHTLDCRCHSCTGRYAPRVAAALILTLALAAWAFVGIIGIVLLGL
jgi:hypothetical protein